MAGYGMSPRRGGKAYMAPKPKATAPRPPAAPPVPGAAPPPAVPNAPLPVDPGYDATMGGLDKTRTTTQAGLYRERQAGSLNYGYTEDPTTGAIAFDSTNPYSQAALLKRQYDQQRTGNTNSMAARGQLYSGALQNAQNATQFNEGVGNDRLLKSYGEFLARNTQDTGQADTDYETGAGAALGDRLGRAPNNPLYSPVTAAAPGAIPPGATTPVPAPPGKPKPRPLAKPTAARKKPAVRDPYRGSIGGKSKPKNTRSPGR